MTTRPIYERTHDTDQRTPDIHTMFAELTRGHTHRERYVYDDDVRSWTDHHPVHVPALVDQLLGATPAGTGQMSGATPVSRPAARIEALDTIMLIDDEAARWIHQLGDNPPGDRYDNNAQPIPGSGTRRRLDRLHGLQASLPRCRPRTGKDETTGEWCCTGHHLDHDVRRWWHQARIITGWDEPPFRPFNTCPVCDHKGGLRINFELQAGFCVECRSVWGPDQIGLLGEHIRRENLDTSGDPHPEATPDPAQHDTPGSSDALASSPDRDAH